MLCVKCGCRLDAITRGPRLLRCGHTFCEICVRSQPGNHLKCVRCKQGTPKSAVVVNKDLVDLLQGVIHQQHLLVKREKDKCPFHSTDRTKACPHCEQHICDMCFRVHGTYDCMWDMLSMHMKLYATRTLARLQASYEMFKETLGEAAKDTQNQGPVIHNCARTIQNIVGNNIGVSRLQKLRQMLLNYANDTQDGYCVPRLQDCVHMEAVSSQGNLEFSKRIRLMNSELGSETKSLFTRKMTCKRTIAVGENLRDAILHTRCGSEMAQLSLLPPLMTKILNTSQTTLLDDILSGLECNSHIRLSLHSFLGEKICLFVTGSLFDQSGLFKQFASKLSRIATTVVRFSQRALVMCLGSIVYSFDRKTKVLHSDSVVCGSFSHEGTFLTGEKLMVLFPTYSFDQFGFFK